MLVRAAISGTRKVWGGEYRYSKAGLITVDLVPLADCQRALPGMDLGDRAASANLMAALDACNRRFGRGAVVPAVASFAAKRTWSTKVEMRSPRYTTRLDELPALAKADKIVSNVSWLAEPGPCAAGIPGGSEADLAAGAGKRV